MKRIFISSVQREFAEVRRLLKRYIARNPAYRRFFDTFVFEEDVVSTDRRTDEVYLDALRNCDIYLGLVGNEYGYEDDEGISPTEREFDEATRLGLPRLMFVLGRDENRRHPKESAFLRKLSENLIRTRCDDAGALLSEIYSSLDALLLEQGAYRIGAFDASPCDGASLADIDDGKVAWFVERARTLRHADLEEGMSVPSVFKHLQLLTADGHLTHAAVLLFGKDPQRFLVTSEVKCVQWYGQERHKPMLSYQIFRGTLFDMADAATAFVLSKLDLAVGTRKDGTTAPREYEVPQSVIAEAVINAIAHRDYSSAGSVQVEVFSNRIVIRNPGQINPALTKAELYEEHASYPNNPKIADQLYQTKHIEKFGTGFTDMVADCRAAGLKDPVLDDSKKEFVLIIWRRTDKPQINTDKAQINSAVSDPVGIVSQIASIIRMKPRISIRALATEINRTENELRTIMGKLRKFGILLRTGARKSGCWAIADWVTDEVLAIEDKELVPVRVNNDGEVEFSIDIDFSDNPVLYEKLKKRAIAAGQSMEDVIRQALDDAISSASAARHLPK